MSELQDITRQLNLAKGRKFSGDYARENQAKARKKHSENVERAKTMAEMANYLLNCPLNEQGKARMRRAGVKVDEKNPTAMTAVLMGQLHGAMCGNAKCAEFVRELIDANAEDTSNAQAFIDALNDREVAEDGEIET